MLEIINFIEDLFPKEWLSKLYLDKDEGSIEISHPNDKEKYLSVCALSDVIGVALLLEEDRSIELDLSGFDYTFSIGEIDRAKDFFKIYLEKGNVCI